MSVRFTLLLLCLIPKISIGQPAKNEADLKAVFIYNFTHYIEWDSSSATGDFIIGIIGESEVSKSLADIAKTNTINNRNIKIRAYDKPENINKCHILFIPKSCPFQLVSILKKTESGVLTISETTGYANMGTALNFVVKDDKLKFEANLKSLDKAGLKASSQLLKLAIIVNQ
jgi:hypothetical protein